MKSLFITIFVLYIFQSCVSVSEPKPLPKYSVYGQISPSDSIIKIFVGKIYTINEAFPLDSGRFFSNAKVYLISDEKELELKFNTFSKNYQSINNHFIIPSKTYKLLVKAPDQQLDAITTVPDKVEFSETSYLFEANKTFVSVKWKDNQAVKNFYRLTGLLETTTLEIPFFYWGDNLSIWKSNDEYLNGKEIIAPQGNFTNSKKNISNKLFITLQNLSEISYDYESKLEAFQTRTSFTEKFESPIFFKTNITNGLGLFGSYTITTKILNIK